MSAANQSPTIRPASPAERDRVFDLLTLAFVADPMVRWLWPDARAFLDAWKRLLTPYGAEAFDHGSAFIAGDFEGAALWLPQGVEADGDAMTMIVAETVAPDRLGEIAALFEKSDAMHPEAPHWYLPVIGCDPAHCGNGLGGALMRHALARVDEAGLPAYLESSNPRNISLYLRHGFEVVGEIQHGSSPVLTPMWREARG